MSNQALPRYIRPLFNKLTTHKAPLRLNADGAHLPGVSLITGSITTPAEGKAWQIEASAAYQLDSWDAQSGEAYSSTGAGKIKALSLTEATGSSEGYYQGVPAAGWMWQLHKNDIPDAVRTFMLGAVKKYNPTDLLAGIRWVARPAHRNKIRLLVSDQYRVHEVVLPAVWADGFEGGSGWLHPAMTLAFARKELVDIVVHPENVAVAALSPKPSRSLEYLVADNSELLSSTVLPLVENVLPDTADAGIGGEVNEVLSVLDELLPRLSGYAAKQALVWFEKTSKAGLALGLGETSEHLPLMQVSGNLRLQAFNGTYLRKALAPFAGARFYLGQGKNPNRPAVVTVQGLPVRACIMPIRLGSDQPSKLGPGDAVFDPQGYEPRY